MYPLIARSLLAVLACVPLVGLSGADVIEGTVSMYCPFFFGQAQYQLAVLQEPYEDHTSVWFYFSNSRLKDVGLKLDRGSDRYPVPYGTQFTAKSIAESNLPCLTSTQKTPIGSVSIFSSILVEPGTCHLGLNAGGPVDRVEDDPPRNIFGWAEFYNHGTHIELIRSAVSYRRPGILVGTTTAVPEPSSLASLTLVGCATLTRRRHDHNCHG